MSDMLLDDVNSLLDGDFGDDRILKQIARACKNNEVISNYERNYVKKLAEQYLGRKPDIIPSKKSEHIQSVIPDVIMPKIQPSPQTTTFQSSNTNNSKTSLKNSKLILGLGIVSLIIIVGAVVMLSSNNDSVTPNPVSEIKIQLSVQSDLSSYGKNDIISINGISTSDIVNLSINNEKNELVWAEQISVKNNDVYSTLAIAGGSGWENSGTYSLIVDDGSKTKFIKFSFTL
jgi:hypothetical protein